MSKHKRLWVDTYSPKSLDDYIFQSEMHEKIFRQFVATKNIPHLLFSGVQGSGKTALSEILIKELDIAESDVMVINASDENSVDVIREKIKQFAESYAFGDFKIIRLEEMDYLSQSAMASLRNLMEETSENCRFICTCNYENKIIPALKSRLQQYYFKSPVIEDVYILIADILIAENVEFDVNDLDKYVRACYPDIRKTINTIQQFSVDGKLLSASATENADYKLVAIDLLKESNFSDLCKLILESAAPTEYEDVFRLLYENMKICPKFMKHPDEAIIIMCDYLDKHSRVAVPEINMSAMFSAFNRLG